MMVAAGTAASCGDSDDGGDCPAVPSVAAVISVVDESDTPLNDVTVSFRLDGGSIAQASCGSVTPFRCSVFGEGGSYAITATKAGYETSTLTLTVPSDRCGAVTQSSTIVLVST